MFVQARVAYDVLSDETKRWAYDRFGPEVAGWKHVVTQREYLVRGVAQSVGFYVISAGVYLLMRLTGQLSGSRTSFVRAGPPSRTYRSDLASLTLTLDHLLLYSGATFSSQPYSSSNSPSSSAPPSPLPPSLFACSPTSSPNEPNINTSASCTTPTSPSPCPQTNSARSSSLPHPPPHSTPKPRRRS